MTDRLRNGIDLRTYEGWQADPSQIAVALNYEPSERCLEAVRAFQVSTVAKFESGEIRVPNYLPALAVGVLSQVRPPLEPLKHF